MKVWKHLQLYIQGLPSERACTSVQGSEVVTPAYKWLRAVGDHEFTGLHMDRVFMGRSPRMLTAWIPLGEVPVAQGPILVGIFCRAILQCFPHQEQSFGDIPKQATCPAYSL